MAIRKKIRKRTTASTPASDTIIRKQVAQFLEESHAHAGFDAAVKDFPPELRGRKPEGAPHTAWELLEHMRIAQWDILEFSRDGRHKSPKWPESYWPKASAPADEKAWDESVRRFKADRRKLAKLVLDKSRDLSAIVPYGQSQTLIREALLTIDHNAYHTGEIVQLRRMMGAWK